MQGVFIMMAYLLWFYFETTVGNVYFSAAYHTKNGRASETTVSMDADNQSLELLTLENMISSGQLVQDHFTALVTPRKGAFLSLLVPPFNLPGHQ